MSRRLVRVLTVTALFAAGPAVAQTKAPAPTSTAPKLQFQLDTVPELKAAREKVAAAAAAVKTAKGSGKEGLRQATMLLLAADKARAANDLVTAKALAKEVEVAASAALKPAGAVILPVDALEKKNPKFGGFIRPADGAVPSPDAMGQDPDRWQRVGISPANFD